MTTPQWRDAPSEPGLWLRTITEKGRNIVSGHHVRADECTDSCWAKGSRWLGPFQPDPQQEQA